MLCPGLNFTASSVNVLKVLPSGTNSDAIGSSSNQSRPYFVTRFRKGKLSFFMSYVQNVALPAHRIWREHYGLAHERVDLLEC